MRRRQARQDIQTVRDFLAELGGRCPACKRRLLPKQKKVTHQGRDYHRACVEYRRRV